MATPFRLDGKSALVTGASSGLGRQFALTLARAGAKVAIAARRTDRLQQLADETWAVSSSLIKALPSTSHVTSSQRLSSPFSGKSWLLRFSGSGRT